MAVNIHYRFVLMPPSGYDPLQTEDLNDFRVWDEMERKHLLGSSTRRCFQFFSFGLAGWLWALATLLYCIYGAAFPNVGLVEIYGEKATRMIALMLGLATLCSMSATKAATILLESHEFGQLLTEYEKCTTEKDSAQRDVHDYRYDYECQVQSILLVVKDAFVYGLVIGILLCPAFASDKSYFAGWLALLGWMTVYTFGCKHVFRQVKKLSKCLVQELMDDITGGPAEWTGTGKFWQDMTKKHYCMDLKIASAAGFLYLTWLPWCYL